MFKISLADPGIYDFVTKKPFVPTMRPLKACFGALLFSLYVNYICLYLDPGISHILYAENLQIYAQCHLNDPYALIKKMSVPVNFSLWYPTLRLATLGYYFPYLSVTWG